MTKIALAVCTVLLLGAGCSEPAVDVASEDVDFHAGATFAVQQNWTGVDGIFGGEDTSGARTVTVNDWAAGERAALAWERHTEEETAASVAARAAAASAPVGSGVQVPDPVYETVTTQGTITTDALGNAARITLPSYWPEGDYDVRGDENSVVWLSRAQYDELVATRATHLTLGLFDTTLEDILNVGDNVRAALATLQGNIATDSPMSASDVAKLTADPDWGDYTLTVNGTTSTVKTVTARGAFANLTVLANPDNPLILRVGVKPLSLGLGMLSTLRVINSLAGYHVTAITY